MIRACLAVVLFLGACATGPDPFDNVSRAQQQLDARGIGFGVTRVPGHDAFVFQVRFGASDTASETESDPMAAAQAAAPEGCSVRSLTHQDDGSIRADYECLPTTSATMSTLPTAVHNPH